ncbi:MAG: helix-turn-helix domain-containing protein [Syntrophomonadaceae bacterium]|nr:helix-turn-helix domain-containing protein [Syntrophomonadaceae bacterium]
MDQGYLTIKEYAKLTGLSESTVRRRIKMGRISAVQAEGTRGPQYLIKGEELNRTAATADLVRADRSLSLDQLAVVMFNALRSSLAEYDLALIDKLDNQAATIEAILAANNQALIDKLVNQANEIKQLQEKLGDPQREQMMLEKIDKQALEIQALHNRLNNQGLIDEINRQAGEIRNLHVELYRIRKLLDGEVQKQENSSWWSKFKK